MSDETNDGSPEEEGRGKRERGDLADRLTHHLGAEVEGRYLEIGRQLLSDEVPQRLDLATRVRMKRSLGVDPDGARIHVGEHAQEAAEAMGARAFTLGASDVYFGRGQFQPTSPEGQALLAHELTHVLESTGQPGFSLGTDTSVTGVREGEAGAVAAEKRALAQAATEGVMAAEPAQSLAPGDKAKLVEKVVRILRRAQARIRQRRGG
jgi:hypothetical protein